MNQKGFSCFPAYHTIPGETKGSPFRFFSALRDFFSGKFFSPKGPPFNFFAVLRQTGCWKIPKGPPFQFVFGTVRFFPKIKIFVFFNFFMFCDRMDVEKPQRVPLSVFRPCETLARQSVLFFSKNFRFSSAVKENP